MEPRRREAFALLVVSALVLRPAFRERPRAHGDAGEYLLTAESLVNHASPDLHGEDLLSLGARARGNRIEGTYGRLLSHYVTGRDGRAYGIHFWAYPLVTLPAKLALRAFGGNELKAPQITNAIVFLGALAHVLLFSRLSSRARWLLALLTAASPVLPFVLWPHPEVYSYALATSALVLRRDGRPVRATLVMALASLQNPPLALAAAAVGALAATEVPTLARRAAGAFLPALVPAAFSLWCLGTPCVLEHVGAAAARNLSLRRTAELFFDPNLGMLPHVPLTFAVAALASVARLAARPGRRLVIGTWGLLVAMAFACTAATNWNNGTAGPSRYVVWLLPFLFDLVVRLAESARARRVLPGVVLLAGVSQGALVAARGGLHAPADHLAHSPAARFVLDRWPALYAPEREVFVERTSGTECASAGPYVYRAADGRCRKALAQKRHLPELRERCGEPPGGPDFRSLAAQEGREAWAYVDY